VAFLEPKRHQDAFFLVSNGEKIKNGHYYVDAPENI